MPKKSKSVLLAEYKKSNQQRRTRIALREGFSTVEKYLSYLQTKEVSRKIKVKVKVK